MMPSGAANRGSTIPPFAHPHAVPTLGQLTGQFAHDINNLLAATLTHVELAQRVDDLDQVRRLLSSAVTTIDRQREVTSMMAAMSAAAVSTRIVDLHDVLRAAAEEIATTLGAAIALEWKLDAPRARVRCDRSFVAVALAHIAGECRRAMPDGGSLAISTRNERAARADPDGAFADTILVVMADTRSGERVPDRMRAFDISYADSSRGYGLGLAQVRDTMRRSGGSVRLDTKNGSGAELCLSFRVHADDEGAVV